MVAIDSLGGNPVAAELRAVELNGPIVSDAFDDFWTLYPRHDAKKAARQAWAKIDASLHIPILISVADWRRVWNARDDHRYTPMPASWLNGERWEDEIPNEFRRTHASHVPAAPAAPSERTEMPANVRALIAKLRGKA